jgi:hypothetical protein
MSRPSTRNHIENDTLRDRPPIQWEKCRAELSKWKSTGRIPERFVELLMELGIVVINQAVGGLDAAGRTHLICRRTDLVESILADLDRCGRTPLSRARKKIARNRR